MWLRSDSGVVANNGSVSRWKDMSGHSNDAAQTTPAAEPTVAPKAANGLPVLRFNGTSFMVGASVMPVHSDYSLTFVTRINNFATTNNVVSGVSHAHYLGNDAFVKVLHNTNFATQAVSTIPLTAAFNVVTMTYLESRQRVMIFVNGNLADTAITDANTDPVIDLGAFQQSSFLHGDLGEIVLYSRELSSTDRQQLENYLETKFGIAHPVAYAPPAAGPLLWLKADTGVVVSNGIVTRWLDQSGNGYGAKQDTLTAQPTLLPNAQFTLPAVRFNGTTNFMECASVFPTNSDYSLLYVVRTNNLGATNNIVSGISHAHWLGGNAYPKVLHGNFNTQAVSNIPVVQGEFAIITMTYRDARQRASIYVDSYFADSAIVGGNADSIIYLGAFAKGNFLNGDIAEVLLYKRELSEADRIASETYLFRKYGIALPPPPPIPDSTFSDVPKSEQLYARDANDSATVHIAGATRLTGFDSLYVNITKNGVAWKHTAVPLALEQNLYKFNVNTTIHAEFSEYKYTIGVKSATKDSVLAVRDSVVCGDVYIIDGQSNCIFGGRVDSYEFGRTFGLNASANGRDTSWTVALADVSGNGPDIGAWAMRMQKDILEKEQVPICIINGAVGGTSIEQHARNAANPSDRSTIYGSLLYRVIQSGLQNKAKAIFWYQGESNSIAGYYNNFKQLYNNWLGDYPSLKKFYIVQIRAGCGGASVHRELFRSLGDSLPNIVPISVQGIIGHDGCHYAAYGYDSIGVHMAHLVERDFYGAKDSIDIGGPNIRRAFYLDATNSQIAILFRDAKTGLITTNDSLVGGVSVSMKDAFYLDDSLANIKSVRVSHDTAYLTLIAPYQATTVGYIPYNYSKTSVLYEGPWILNNMGVGAFSFDHYPITPRLPDAVAQNITASIDDPIAVPNPFTSRTELRISLYDATQMQVVLYDELGKEVRCETLSTHAGVNLIPMERQDLPSGHYECNIISNGSVRMIPLVIQ
ncbi:MAG: sialate O-acetylesterase [Candidatus Kapaibacterium sp.]